MKTCRRSLSGGWIGNCSTSEIEVLIRDHLGLIGSFDDNESESVLILP